MARSISEEEIRLRKRARRRLIGAIALTTLVVVTLPMVLDSEPRPIGHDIAVQIPSPNSGPYAPKGQAEAARTSAAPGNTNGTVNAPPLAPADDPRAAPASSATPSSAVGTAAPARGPSSATPADQKIEVTGALRPPSDGAGGVVGTAAGTAADTRNAAETAAAVRAAEAKAATEARSAPTKGADAKGSESKVIPGDAEAKNFVIQLGAFAEISRAKDRHAQLVKAGVKSYTEVVKTPTGDKTRVRAGPFPTREAAEQVNERLKGLGMTDGIVVPRRY
ncbi:MAG: SPOR domain-containing protein [Rhodocyclaceae bacterium]|nr:SPOR domain-containing protein [Rhodocyclaceae bacterium]